MKYIIYLLLALVFFSCKNKKDKVAGNSIPDKIVIMEADRAFSKMSAEKGMKNAFIEYIDSNGVLLRPGHLPFTGANAIDYLIQLNDKDYTITWQPHNAFVAASGDLGFTYGIYALRPHAKDTTLYGTYVSIWKKQKDGKWKFILDSGNEGLGEQPAFP